MSEHRLIIGDVIERLRELPDGSVHCVVTSPPYWGLRDYGTATWEGGDAGCDHVDDEKLAERLRQKKSMIAVGERIDGSTRTRVHDETIGKDWQYRGDCQKCGAKRIDQQIGLEKTPAEFVAKMVAVFAEVRRVLHPSGVCFINLGDSYASDPKKGGSGTPNGRNGRGEGYARARRGAVCDNGDIALGDFPARECLCGSLCDVCRAVYRRTTHNDPVLVSMLHASLHGSSHERMESSRGHLPTSDSQAPAVRIASANQDRGEIADHDGAPLRASLESMLDESSPQLLDECLRRASCGECLLCARSLGDCAPPFACKTVCTCDSERRLGALARDRSGSVSSDLAYPHYTTATLKPKDLCGIPWLVAFALRDAGWWLRSDIIWSKPNPMPESVTDRPTKAHEYLFLLTKSQRYFFDAEAVKEMATAQSVAAQSFVRETKEAEVPGQSCKQHRLNRSGPRFGGNKYPDNGSDGPYSGNEYVSNGSRNLRSVWTIPTHPFPEAHFATFPPAIPERCIKAGTSEKGCCPKCLAPWERITEREQLKRERPNDYVKRNGQAGTGNSCANSVAGVNVTTLGWKPSCECGDHQAIPCTVLDPFAGSGTTLMVARQLGRNGIGIELNPEYAAMAEKRIESALRPSTYRDMNTKDDSPLFTEAL